MKLELNKCINRQSFKILTIVLMLLSVSSFVAECVNSKGLHMSSVRSASEVNIVLGSNSFLFIIVILLPLISGIIYADSYFEEKRQGVIKSIATRANIVWYLWKKALIVFIINFLVFIITAGINLILCMLFFPKFGYESQFALPEYARDMSYVASNFIDYLRIENPTLYCGVIILNIGIFSGLIGLILYGLFFLTKKSKLYTLIQVYIVFVVIEVLGSVFGLTNYVLTSYMFAHRDGTLGALLTLIIILSVVSVMLIKIGIDKETYDIGL